MHRAAFEPATPANKRPQTYALERAATGIGFFGQNIQLKLLNITAKHTLLFGPET
jgi:hypothetical protein